MLPIPRLLARSVAILAVWLLATASASAIDEVDQLIASLLEARPSAPPEIQKKTDNAIRLLSEFDGALQRGDVAQAKFLWQQLSVIETLSADHRKKVEQLAHDLPAKVAERVDRFVSDVEAGFRLTRERCLAATTDHDLFPHYRELLALSQRQPAFGSTPLLEKPAAKLRVAIMVCSSWMDYLAVGADGNPHKARAILDRIRTEMESAYPVLSAIEIDKRIVELDAEIVRKTVRASTVLARIQSPQDVEKVVPTMEALPNEWNAILGDSAGAKLWFKEFREANAAYLAGDLTKAFDWLQAGTYNAEGSWAAEVVRLRAMLFDAAITSYLHLSAGSERQPGEQLTDFLLRLLRAAAKQDRWDEVRRIATIPLKGSTSFPPWRASWRQDIEAAAKSWLEGQRAEEIGDYPKAILSYEAVLRSPAEVSPAEKAVARLKALHISQPSAFADAHPRFESDLALGRIRELEEEILKLNFKIEQARAAALPPSPIFAAPAAAQDNADFQKFENRLALVENTLAKPDTLETRLQQLEVLLGPGAKALAPDFDKRVRFRIWLGPDYTVYRSALPTTEDATAVWHVERDGGVLLSRNASDEYAYRYHDLQPGVYTIYLRSSGEGGDLPASNVLSFRITKEIAKTLPKIQDDDWDRDGVPNNRDEH